MFCCSWLLVVVLFVVVELGPIPKITRIRHIFRGTKQ